MSQLKLTADSGGGTVAIKGPASTTGNAALEMTVPSAASGTLDSLNRAGNILQVVNVFSNTHMTSTSTSYVDLTGITATITPASSSNKILIVCNIALSKQDNHSFLGIMLRNGSTISGSGGVAEDAHGNQEAGTWWNVRNSNSCANPSVIHYLDSPATTSAVTYKAQGKTSNATKAFSLNKTNGGANYSYSSPTFSSITLWEVVA